MRDGMEAGNIQQQGNRETSFRLTGGSKAWLKEPEFHPTLPCPSCVTWGDSLNISEPVSSSIKQITLQLLGRTLQQDICEGWGTRPGGLKLWRCQCPLIIAFFSSALVFPLLWMSLRSSGHQSAAGWQAGATPWTLATFPLHIVCPDDGPGERDWPVSLSFCPDRFL